MTPKERAKALSLLSADDRLKAEAAMLQNLSDEERAKFLADMKPSDRNKLLAAMSDEERKKASACSSAVEICASLG